MRIYIGFFFLFFATQLVAQNSLLWEISGNGLQKKSYLYGTIHIQDKRVFQFGDSLMPRFNACSAFAGELLLNESDPEELMQLMFMPGDTTLKMLLSKADYKLVEKYSQEKLGAMAGMVDRIKPLFTASMITETSLKKDEPFSLDEYFQKFAKAKNMEVIGIETVDEQIKALDRVSLKEQAQMLVDGVKEESKNTGTDTTAIEKLISIYLTQNLDSIQHYISNQDLSDVFSQSIILERNHKMAERIGVLIKSKPAFIGVGAAHLPGQEGVIALLKQQGFTLRPVYSPFNKNNIPTPTISEGWMNYEPAGETFKVLMPSVPQVRHDTAGSANVTSAICVDSSSYQFYMLTYFDVPERTSPKKENEYYDELIKKLTKNKNSRLIYRKDIDENGLKGIEAVVKTYLGQVMRIRVFLYEGKAVQLAIAGSKDSVKSANAEKFLNSFSFNSKN